jgi:signal transduction histidine kinase
MKLSNKVLLTIITAWILIIGGTYIGALQILQKSYANLEEKQILGNLNILNQVLESLGKSNLATITSWTNWDTLYNHMIHSSESKPEETKKFFEGIINSGALISSMTDIYLVFTAQGNPYFSAALNSDKTQLIPASKEIMHFFEKNGDLRKLLNTDTSGLISTSDSILILGFHRIFPSIGQGIPQGTGVIFTYLTDTVWDKVKQDSKLKLNLYHLIRDKNNPDVIKELPILLEKNIDINNVDQNTTFLYTLIKDINHKPIGMVKVTAQRPINLLGKKTIFYFNVTFIFLGIIFSLFLFYLLRFLVIDRLSNINDQVRLITSTKNFNLKIREKGEDEISTLGVEINKMLEIIAEIETLLTNTINFMPSIMLIVDKNLNIINLNHFAEKELGFPANSQGKSLFYFLPFLSPYKEKFYNLQQGFEIEKINDTTGDRVKYFKVFIYPLRQSNEKSLVVRLDDITKRIQMNKILTQQAHLSAVGVLTAGVAHEINNPINFVSSSIDPLKKDIAFLYDILEKYLQLKKFSKDELKQKLEDIDKLKQSMDFKYTINETNQLFEGMHEGINRIKNIIRDLKILSKDNADTMEKADIHQGIDDTLTLLKNRYKDKIEIIKDYDSNIPNIDCYYGKLNQVFMNIVANAIEAISNEGQIKIKTKKIDNNIKIIISDTGVGISENNIKKIFNPFYTTKTVSKGTGLGLSIVSSIIRDHGGNIDVSSEVGRGSTFTITLPFKTTTKLTNS